MITTNAIIIDAGHLELLEPVRMQPGVQVKVWIWNDSEENQQVWADASLQALNAAYGENEPLYSEALIKEPNPVYKA